MYHACDFGQNQDCRMCGPKVVARARTLQQQTCCGPVGTNAHTTYACCAHLSTASTPFTSPSAGAPPSCRTTSAAVSSTTFARVTLAYRPATRQAFAAADASVDARSSMMLDGVHFKEAHTRDLTRRSSNTDMQSLNELTALQENRSIVSLRAASCELTGLRVC